MMDRHDIPRSPLSVSSPDAHLGDSYGEVVARHVNDFGADVVRAHSDRFGLFGLLPLPDVQGTLAEIDHILDDLGADGLAVESNGHVGIWGIGSWNRCGRTWTAARRWCSAP